MGTHPTLSVCPSNGDAPGYEPGSFRWWSFGSPSATLRAASRCFQSKPPSRRMRPDLDGGFLVLRPLVIRDRQPSEPSAHRDALRRTVSLEPAPLSIRYPNSDHPSSSPLTVPSALLLAARSLSPPRISVLATHVCTLCHLSSRLSYVLQDKTGRRAAGQPPCRAPCPAEQRPDRRPAGPLEP